MIHAFNLGQFSWNIGTHGGFVNGNHGDGSESWAFVPSSQLDKLRNNVPRSSINSPILTTNPHVTPASVAQPYCQPGDVCARASMDSAITLEDVYLQNRGGFRTVAVAAESRNHPYVTALDVSASTPQPIWTTDWTDVDFQGTDFSPAVAPIKLASPNTRVFAAITTSGLTTVAWNEFVYIISLENNIPTTLAKVQLNFGSWSAPTFGIYGNPVLVDTYPQDGVIDRIYVADTAGNLFKINTATLQPPPSLNTTSVTRIASLGQTVYSPLAIMASQTATEVQVFAGGGDDPDLLDSPAGQYNLFGFEDDDPEGTSVGPYKQIANIALPAGQKMWAPPVVTADAIYATTATGDIGTVCGVTLGNSGYVLAYPLSGLTSSTSNPSPLYSRKLTNIGNPSGLISYDGHLIAGTWGGQSIVITNKPVWNNTVAGSVMKITTPLWTEDSGGAKCNF
jgi:hypothetical protein